MEIHLLWGLLIPALFFFFTGLVKSLIRKEVVWSNFYLGIDIALAGLANGIVNIVDEVHQAETSQIAKIELGEHMFYTSMYMMAAIDALLVVMTLHQKFEIMDSNISNQRVLRGIWLGVVSNLLGGALLGFFIFMKLRNQV
jgi:hypothetical protein